jgi:hypothetical protein
MLECFEKIVGSKSCNDIGYDTYIETLNISVKKLAGIANGAQLTGKDYLKSKVGQALDLVLDGVAQNLDPLTNPVKLVQFNNTYNQLHNGLRGVTLESKCNLERLYIDFVMFKGNDSVNGKELKIIDGANEYTFTFNSVAGVVVTIPINQQFQSSKVQILVDNSDVRTAQNKHWNYDCSCNYDGQTYGISLVGHYKCEETLLLCQLNSISSFKNAVLYKVGGLICEDLHNSTQLNEIVITKSDNLEAQADTFHHRSEQFAKSAKKSFDKLIKQSCCYDCNETTVVNFSM